MSTAALALVALAALFITSVLLVVVVLDRHEIRTLRIHRTKAAALRRRNAQLVLEVDQLRLELRKSLDWNTELREARDEVAPTVRPALPKRQPEVALLDYLWSLPAAIPAHESTRDER